MSLRDAAAPRSSALLGPNWTRLIWSPVATRGETVTAGRDPRLDMFRGIALIMIFINHVPGTIYENFTSRNFGFSDAAEAFVFMSGMAAGLACSNRFRTGNRWAAMARVWARARQLYFVHIAITMASLAIFAAAAMWFDLPELLLRNNIQALFTQPLATLIGIPLLSHQLGYLNILPLYMLLVLATPVFLLVGLRRPWLMLTISGGLWALAGQFRLNIPAYPNAGGWFFNPLSWQVLFVVGLLSGAAIKVGRRLVPYRPGLFAAAAAFVVLVLLWVRVPAIGQVGQGLMNTLGALGAPFYLVGFDKSFLSLPRLLHALALFYVLGHLPVMRTLAASSWAAPFRLLGRQGLAVFAVGTVLSMLLQAVKAGRQPDPLFDGMILGLGVVALLALAWILTRTAQIRSATTADASLRES